MIPIGLTVVIYSMVSEYENKLRLPEEGHIGEMKFLPRASRRMLANMGPIHWNFLELTQTLEKYGKLPDLFRLGHRWFSL